MGRSRAVKELRARTLSSSLMVQVDDDGKLMVKCSPIFRRELNKILREIKEEARDIVKRNHSKPDRDGRKRTGALRRSIQVGDIKTTAGGQRLVGTVTAGSRLAKYAWYVHQGTDPGRRTVKNPSRFFYFKWAGKFKTSEVSTEVMQIMPNARRGAVPVLVQEKSTKRSQVYTRTKSVNHPGNEADKFLNKAAIKVVRRYGGARKQRDGTILR